MVRPVEPERPAAASREPVRVRGTTATPERFGQTPVRNEGERSGRRKEKPKDERPADSVCLEAHPEGTESPFPGGTQAQEHPQQKSCDHLDVTG
jgi:hypothetical protein